MLFTTPGIPDFVSGVILFDETLRQKTKDGVNFGEYLKKNGILPGIKVDAQRETIPPPATVATADPTTSTTEPSPDRPR